MEEIELTNEQQQFLARVQELRRQAAAQVSKLRAERLSAIDAEAREETLRAERKIIDLRGDQWPGWILADQPFDNFNNWDNFDNWDDWNDWTNTNSSVHLTDYPHLRDAVDLGRPFGGAGPGVTDPLP
ncbi:hypothetical protein [Actinomadura alba]|uniref:Uncharacterized protein n=1 Tax=Actinomadura alba TaxID=406431 RepID=A0ABR7LSM2_9ACTN|nr:hypothetical protein [Actinomadura alba]MBC6467760.1 hypothetical protein [Actinomadura alba]